MFPLHDTMVLIHWRPAALLTGAVGSFGTGSGGL
jgi:hypothetical protein